MRIGGHTSSTLFINTKVPQGCVLSPLLYTLFTHDCCAIFPSNHIKFVDDTTVLGLINNNDETAYRNEVQHLALWCDNNSLVLNIKKTKEIIVDFRKTGECKHSPLTIGNSLVERVTDFKFLVVIVSEDLSWSTNTASFTGNTQQRL